jgi:hypothetical protein
MWPIQFTFFIVGRYLQINVCKIFLLSSIYQVDAGCKMLSFQTAQIPCSKYMLSFIAMKIPSALTEK